MISRTLPGIVTPGTRACFHQSSFISSETDVFIPLAPCAIALGANSLGKQKSLLPYRVLRDFGLNLFFLIAKTADRIAVVLAVAATVHGGVIVVQVAVPSGTAGSLRRTPKVGVAAEIGEATATVVAGWQRTEAGGIVRTLIIAHNTCSTIGRPTRCVCQCFCDIRRIIAAQILALAAHIVLQFRPFRITRHVPTRGANALHTARISLTTGRIAHHSLPVVKITVVKRSSRCVVICHSC